MKALSVYDYAALTPPEKAIGPERAVDLARRGFIVLSDDGWSFALTFYGALAVRVYEAWRTATVPA